MRKKKLTSRSHVFGGSFDKLCQALGPQSDGGDKRVGKILGRCERSVKDWRSGAQPCPRWAYELVRLTLDERWRARESMNRMPHGPWHLTTLFHPSSSLYPDARLCYPRPAANDQCNVLELPDLA